jgi:hypothetical protein
MPNYSPAAHAEWSIGWTPDQSAYGGCTRRASSGSSCFAADLISDAVPLTVRCNPSRMRAVWRCYTRPMEATYRIISQADGTFAVERTEPGKPPVVTGHFKTEKEAHAHVADLKKRPPDTD